MAIYSSPIAARTPSLFWSGVQKTEFDPQHYGDRDYVMNLIHKGRVDEKAHAARAVVVVDRIGRILGQLQVKLDRVVPQQQKKLVERQTSGRDHHGYAFATFSAAMDII